MAEYSIHTYKEPRSSSKDPNPALALNKVFPLPIGDSGEGLLKTQKVLADWCTVEHAKAILDYAATMKLTIGIGRLGEVGVTRLAEGHPALSRLLRNADTINARFLRKQAYRLAQIGMLLDSHMQTEFETYKQSYRNKKIENDDADIVTGKGKIWFEPSKLLGKESSKIQKNRRAQLSISEDLKLEKDDRKISLFLENVFAQFRSVLDLEALKGSEKEKVWRLPRPSQIRLHESLIQPLADAESICAFCFTLKIKIGSNLFWENIPQGEPSNEEKDKTHTLNVQVPMGVFRPDDKDKNKYRVDEIKLDNAKAAFTKDTFVPGLDLRFLYRMAPSMASGTDGHHPETLAPVPFGAIGIPPMDEIKEHIYWLNKCLDHVAREKLGPDRKVFRPRTKDLEEFFTEISKAETEARSSARSDQEGKECRSRKQKEVLESHLGQGLAVFCPDGMIHLLDTSAKVQAWSREHEVWNSLRDAGEHVGTGNGTPPSSIQIHPGQAIPRAKQLGFPPRWAIDMSMDLLGIEDDEFEDSTKEFRDLVAQIHEAKTVESQVNGLLQIPKRIRRVRVDGVLTKSSYKVLEKIPKVQITPKQKDLTDIQNDTLTAVEAQAGHAARELLRYRAADKEREKNEGGDHPSLIRAVLNYVPSRREFDSWLNRGNQKAFEPFRALLLQMEYARDLPLDDQTNLKEVDRIFTALMLLKTIEPKSYGYADHATKQLAKAVKKGWKGRELKGPYEKLFKKGSTEKLSIPFVADLFRTVASDQLKKSSKEVKLEPFVYPTVEGFKKQNEFFNDIINCTDAASAAKKAAHKAPNLRSPSLSLAPHSGDHDSFLKALGSVAAVVPCPSVFAFGAVGLLENMWRGKQVHEHLKVIKAFQKNLPRHDHINEDEKEKDETNWAQLDADKFNPLTPENTVPTIALTAWVPTILEELKNRKKSDRNRRAARSFLAGGTTALLIAGVATGGAALLVAGAAVGAVKTIEGVRYKVRNWMKNLDVQLEKEANLAAMSAQLGNPMAIELGLLLFFEFSEHYNYRARYRAVEHGMQYTDWYDAYVEGYKSFAKVK